MNIIITAVNKNDTKNILDINVLDSNVKSKSYACDSLKPIHKNRQEEMRFTFDVAKCDRIFDELHKAGCIRMSHSIPPLYELKRRAYY